MVRDVPVSRGVLGIDMDRGRAPLKKNLGVLPLEIESKSNSVKSNGAFWCSL